MGKKVLIAAIAVVVALVVINFTRLGSHIKLWKHQLGVAIQAQIPPEQEIARLKMELDNLGKEDEKHFHKVATQVVEVQNMEKEVAALIKQKNDRAASIMAMREAMKGDAKFITYADQKFAREKFMESYRTAGASFLTFEEYVSSKEDILATRQKSLEANKKKLLELKTEREKMRADLERLQLAIEQERQAQAEAANAPDDAHYLRIRSQMEEVSNKIRVEQQKRMLKGEVDTPVRAAEQKKEQDAALERSLDNRFSDKNKQ